jgi:hypothetical protein
MPAAPELPVEVKNRLREQIGDLKATDAIKREVIERLENASALVLAGRFADARDAVAAISDETEDLVQLKAQFLRQISEAEQLQVRVNATAEECGRLVREAGFAEARRMVEQLPDEPPSLQEPRRRLLEQIGEAEHLQERFSSTVEECTRLVGEGRFAEARDLVESLPDQPGALTEQKGKLHGQISEFEGQHARMREEVSEQLANLEAVGLSRGSVLELAREHDVQPDDVFRFHGFLEALQKQLPGSVRRKLKKRAKRG